MSCNACILPSAAPLQCTLIASIDISCKKDQQLYCEEGLNLPSSEYNWGADAKHWSLNQQRWSPTEQHRHVCHYWTERLPSRLSSTYVSWDQEGPAQVLVKWEAPGFSVAIHTGDILFYCLIIEPEPYTIIIMDLRKTSNRAKTKHPVIMKTGWATPAHTEKSH